MTDSIPVHINRQQLHGLEVPAGFETSESFDVRLINHGEALHVHLHIDDDLSEVATLEATNHYVKPETERRVRVDVAEDAPRPVRGSLKVVTGYGAQTRYIDVDVVEPSADQDPVEVDEELGKPQPKQRQSSQSALTRDRALPVLALGAIALLVALLSATILDNVTVMLGSLGIVGAVLVALFVLSIDR